MTKTYMIIFEPNWRRKEFIFQMDEEHMIFSLDKLYSRNDIRHLIKQGVPVKYYLNKYSDNYFSEHFWVNLKENTLIDFIIKEYTISTVTFETKEN